MRLPTLLFAAVLFGVAANVNAQRAVDPPESIGEIEVVDQAAEQLIDPSATIEVLATDFEWSEGPVWLRDQGCVLFSDIPRNSIFKWKEGEGLSLYLKPSGYTGETPRGGEPGSNGLMIDAQGRLVMCQHGDAQVARMAAPLSAPRPVFEVIADKLDGKRLNSPNDLVIHSSGAIYFTDPPYGRLKAFNDKTRELDFQGVYRVSPEGELSLLTKELVAPNGIALSPDEQTLYVAQSNGERPIYMAYAVQADGSIDDGRVLLNVKHLGRRPGSPDGMAIDRDGNLFATGPGGVLIISPGGKHLATIRTGERIANCTFGGPDGRTLFMTSDMHLCRVRVKTAGLGF
ncbi:Gluconolactonase precursor [Posidoniimonas polymericola]|uniref:Gluconolactonase n=1 Tax=Posidoniimonas polymericola TaxID=2528002 RepID=A0A5C5YU64_9BACT|nr:SMP-30/gluconolactonase/LRE family protein [Posidoniimonas polymericola]TWT78559.1 Gluconolactonase precursor [Posidoniimonas polymericola]